MNTQEQSGYIHSFQSLGAVDGPGVRSVVFMQGCHLRCGCCHNPDTWQMTRGMRCTAAEIFAKVERCRDYFGENGGITVSGGEPLLQASFVADLFMLCREHGIHTCLDTSGSVLNESVKAMLNVTDRVLLDIKYTQEDLYREHVGCELRAVLIFLSFLNECRIPVTLRQVIIPTLNDGRTNLRALAAIAQQNPCVDSIELLPFRKLCQAKYDRLGIAFPFSHVAEPTEQVMSDLKTQLSALCDVQLF